MMIPTVKDTRALQAGRLKKALDAAIRRARGRQVTVLFSGGFDSVFLMRAAARLGVKATAVTIAFEKYNATTVREAACAAATLKIRHKIISVSVDEYLKSCVRIARCQESKDPDWDLPLVHAALGKLSSRDVIVLAGMGSDEVLGDRSCGRPGFAVRAAKAVRSRRVHERVGVMQGRKMLFPFLTQQVIDVASALPAPLRRGKKLLRSLDPEAQRIVLSLRHGARALPAQVPAVIRRLALRALKAHTTEAACR